MQSSRVSARNKSGKDQAEVDGGPKYHLDLQLAEARRRSLPLLIAGRKCYQHQQGDTEEELAASDPQDQISQIASHCSQTPDYMLPDTPLKEAIFRTLVAEDNRPMTASEVSGCLAERWAMTAHARDISQRVIQRLLDHSETYCIARVGEPSMAAEAVGEAEGASPQALDVLAEEAPPTTGEEPEE